MYARDIFLFDNIFVHAFIALNIYFRSVSGNLRGLRIFQGRDARRDEFPYAVALSYKWANSTDVSYDLVCTGSIVKPIWVVTAAHCTISVEYCFNYLNNSGINIKICKPIIQFVSPADNYKWVDRNIIRTFPHPSFKNIPITTKNFNDIALVKVQDTKIAALGKMSPVHFGTMYGHKVFALGLGRMKSESGEIRDAMTLNKPLQVYDAIVIKCGRVKKFIGSSSFCLAWNYQKPSTSCHGDSGGPIVHPSGIIGVTTAGDNVYCNSTENTVSPNLATPVSPYVDWIAGVIRGT